MPVQESMMEIASRVLIVEDDDDYAAFLETVIGALGEGGMDMPQSLAPSVIERVTTAEAAIDRLGGENIDLCLLDYYLADGSTGLDVLHGIDANRFKTAFVFLTARDDRETAFEALRLGAMDYLLKAQSDPFALEKSISFALYRKRREIDLKETALRDPLTGLGNRMLFGEQLNQSLKQAKREHERVGLVYIDLDDFKPVNDQYGHQVGDELLKQIARRLTRATRESDILARQGGDEFAVILSRVQDTDAVSKVSVGIARALVDDSYQIGPLSLRIGASVGFAVYPDDSENPYDLVRIADSRMYERKRATKGTAQAAS